MTAEQFSKAGFLKSYVVPALFVLLVPGVGIWFAGHAVRSLDNETRATIIETINAVNKRPEKRAELIAYYQTYPASTICGRSTPDFEVLATAFDNTWNTCWNHRQLALIRQLLTPAAKDTGKPAAAGPNSSGAGG